MSGGSTNCSSHSRPTRRAIEGNIRRALYLCDESAFRYYKDWEEKGYYNRIISANINQTVRVDSVACDFERYPYIVTTYARQSLVRSSNITERSLVTRCRLLNSVRSDNNPHGFTMEQFTILEKPRFTDHRKVKAYGKDKKVAPLHP